MPSINLARVSPGESTPESPTQDLCDANAKQIQVPWPENSNMCLPRSLSERRGEGENAALSQSKEQNRPFVPYRVIYLLGRGEGSPEATASGLGAHVPVNAMAPGRRGGLEAFGSQAA